MVFPRDPDGIVNVVNHKYTPQKIPGKPYEFLIALYKPGGGSYGTRLTESPFFRKLLSCVYAVQRKKCRPPVPVFFQELYHCFGDILIFGNYVLDTSAKSCLNGDLIILFNMYQVSNNPEYAGIFFLLLHYPSDGIAIAVVSLSHVPQAFKP